MFTKSDVSFPRFHIKALGISFVFLPILTGCFGSPVDRAVKKTALQNGNLKTCPDSVHPWAQSGGVISLNWVAYAPDVNTYATMVIVPNDGRPASNVSDTNTNGSFNVSGHTAGIYTIYYTVRPGSPHYPACSGVEHLTFW